MYNDQNKLNDNAGAELISYSFRDESFTQSIYLSREQLRERVGCYGFIECDDILRFISFICSSPPEKIDYIFIRGKIDKCLRFHDDGSDYFIPIRELATELDCLIA